MNQEGSAPALWHHRIWMNNSVFWARKQVGFGINEPVEVEPLECTSVGHAAVMQTCMCETQLQEHAVVGKR